MIHIELIIADSPSQTSLQTVRLKRSSLKSVLRGVCVTIHEETTK